MFDKMMAVVNPGGVAKRAEATTKYIVKRF